jgi:cytochrome c551/c552
MSKWIKKELFQKAREEIINREEEKKNLVYDNRRWTSLARGTIDKPMLYEGRFLPDKNGVPTYKTYYYHMYDKGEGLWQFILCEKTYGKNNFCGFCHAVSRLWLGSQSDKALAGKYSKKRKHVINFFVVNDPRDADVPGEIENRDEKIMSGKVKIFEMADKLESKVKIEVEDDKKGLGELVYDPEEGYNFNIIVKSTKADKLGRVYHDYADSKFDRRPSSLGNDKRIREILDSCHDLQEYLDSLRKSPEEIKTLLEQEMLWDIVKSEWDKNFGKPTQPTKNESDTYISKDEEEFDDLDKELANL